MSTPQLLEKPSSAAKPTGRVGETKGATPTRRFGRAYQLLLILAVWRLATFAIGKFAKAILQVHPDFIHWESLHKGIRIWNQWDAGYFVSIAEHGYDRPDWPAFLPLFPLSIRVVRLLSFNTLSFDAAALVANFVFMGAALVVLLKLANVILDSESGFRAGFYLLIFPTAVFLLAPYSEPLFLLTTVSSFYMAEKQKWPAAALLGGLAAATRLTGIVMLPALGIRYLEKRGWKPSKLGWQWIWLALVPLGVIAYFLFLMTQGKGFDGYFDALRFGWPGRDLTINVARTLFAEVVPYARGEAIWGGAVVIIDFLSLVAVAGGLVLIWKLLPKAYFVFSFLMLLTILTSSIPTGGARYFLGQFPLFLLLGRFGRSRIFDGAYVAVCVPLMGLITAMWTIGYWAG